MQKKIILIVAVILTMFLVITGILWGTAYNKAIRNANLVKQEKTKIYTAYAGRYDKVFAFIDAIESANAQINTQIDSIMAARTAFASALAAGNLDGAEENSEILENTFISLVSYMEDNPSAWNTVGLTAGFMSEFAASTNAVTYAINTYNETVAKYNITISVFPNKIFLGGFPEINDYVMPEFNTELPTFN